MKFAANLTQKGSILKWLVLAQFYSQSILIRSLSPPAHPICCFFCKFNKNFLGSFLEWKSKPLGSLPGFSPS